MPSKYFIFVTVLLILLEQKCVQEFTNHFNNFIEKNYNISVRIQMERIDLGWGNWGSFGGKISDNDVLRKRPVIFIPGAQLRSFMFSGAKNYFMIHGYNSSELYSTSYGDGGWTLLPFFKLRCDVVKQIRLFIKIVNKYANKTVDIVTYSLGAPFVRKAILGGSCVDTNEALGSNITNLINTFVTISGANYGVESCNFLHFFIPYCNPINGFYCLSKFIIDINNETNSYEGMSTYSFISKSDLTSGKNCCGKNCSELKYATKNVILQNSNHLSIYSEFTPNFQKFIKSIYGNRLLSKFERLDLGKGGSFGGKNKSNDKIRHNPIIFIHGATRKADTFTHARVFFTKHGYKSGELYGMSYYDDGRTPLTEVILKCSDVHSIRQFIILVHKYTNKKVNVVGYSMGSPLTRKAILGGKCADKNFNLGEPITELVENYVSIAGVANGYEACSNIFNSAPFCNKINGFACNSKFIKNLNNINYRYEGKNSYAIYSETDSLVGQRCCGNRCSALTGATKNIRLNGNDHASILPASLGVMFKLFN
uniref:Lipase domain-containing protein n=1 Tax=Strongyloides stercoralis TaxID=6248 RepID=A0AAF5DAB0_STRER